MSCGPSTESSSPERAIHLWDEIAPVSPLAELWQPVSLARSPGASYPEITTLLSVCYIVIFCISPLLY